MTKTTINGFQLEVSTNDRRSRVRVSLQDGKVVVDTDLLSVKGLGNLADVFTTAAKIAARGMYDFQLRDSTT
jgi:hypothetical protein